MLRFLAAAVSLGRETGVVTGAALSCSGSFSASVGDLDHGVDEGVERLLALGLGRLDHHGLGHDQREVDRRRMEAAVDQSLGDVDGVDAVGGLVSVG